jgi:mannose-1-phosphate guanylyltransferase
VLTVVMAGGIGERFWPQSRRKRPKQLLDLTGRGSMIRLTIDRLAGLSEPEEIFVVTNVAQLGPILRELSGMVPAENIIGEPVGRNTAPCIGLAAVLLSRTYGNRPMLVLAADHLIERVKVFQELVRAGEAYVTGRPVLLTFGVRPTRAETGYGYIEAGELLREQGRARIYRAEAFLEKPDAERAREFVESGSYYWNSGMFMWTTDTILSAVSTHLPELSRVLSAIDGEIGTRPLEEVLKAWYPQAPSISVDYGVMEKADDVVVMEAEFDWNDVGSWESIRDVHPADARGNVCIGDHVLIDAADNTIVARDRTVAIVGVDQVVVVDGGDTILVCRRDRVQDVKKIVKILRDRNRDELV